MPFGPLVTLMLLVYILFLGVVLTLWFILSPGRKPDIQENVREDVQNAEQDEAEFWNLQRERPTRAEERSAKRSARVYAGSSNDEVRGANAKANRASETGREKVETSRRAWNTGARTRTRDTRARNPETRDAGTRDTERDTEARNEDAKRTPAPSTATTKKRSSDAFEDFIRSKNDDFEF